MTDLPSLNLPCFDAEEPLEKIRTICEQYEIDVELIMALCQITLAHSGAGRARNINSEFDGAIGDFLERTSAAAESVGEAV